MSDSEEESAAIDGVREERAAASRSVSVDAASDLVQSIDW